MQLTHTPRTDRARNRRHRERVIRRRIREAKQMRPRPIVLNTSLASVRPLLRELAGTPEIDERHGPIVALHPDTVRRARPESAPWLLWPFHWERGRFADHPFSRRRTGRAPTGETTRPGWRSRAKQQWKREALEEALCRS